MAEEGVTNNVRQLNISSNLDETRKASIRKALKEYRAECLRQNLMILCIHWQAVRDDGEEAIKSGLYTAEEVEEAARDAFDNDYNMLQYETVKTLLSPEESPERSQFIADHILDGVDHTPVDFALRKKWWDSIWGAIMKKKDVIPPEQFPPGLPDDLQYLTTLVSAVLGPNVLGDPEEQFRNFVSPLTESEIYEALLAGKDDGLSVPCLGNWMEKLHSLEIEDLNDYNHYLGNGWGSYGWDVAVGLCTSSWPHPGYRSFMVYCRPQKGDGEWAWRYGWDNPVIGSNSDLFDSVEEYLQWFVHWGVDDEEYTRSNALFLNLLYTYVAGEPAALRDGGEAREIPVQLTSTAK